MVLVVMVMVMVMVIERLIASGKTFPPVPLGGVRSLNP